MKKVFGMNKGKESSPSIQDASDRMNQRGEKIDDKIKKLDAKLTRYREQIKKTHPGPAQETMKARATRIHDQIRIYRLVPSPRGIIGTRAKVETPSATCSLGPVTGTKCVPMWTGIYSGFLPNTKVKKTGMPPGPRTSFSMCVHKKRDFLFGGVVDMEMEGDYLKYILVSIAQIVSFLGAEVDYVSF